MPTKIGRNEKQQIRNRDAPREMGCHLGARRATHFVASYTEQLTLESIVTDIKPLELRQARQLRRDQT